MVEADESRIYCPAGRLWRRSGGVPGNVCMSRKDNRVVAAMDSGLLPGHDEVLRHTMRR